MEWQDALSPVPEAAREGTPDAAIYDAIYGAVMERRLLPGARLTEASLCEIFGVSRAAVRSALLRLSHDRIVTLTPNRGAAISRPTVRETREVFEMRRLIETAAMELVAERALPRDFEALRELVHQEHAAFERGNLRQWTRLSGEFHLCLLAAAKNGVLSEAGRDLVTRSLLMSTLYMPPGRPSCASHEHEQLIDALAAGEGKRAARLMGAHLQACEARLHLDAPAAAAPDLAAALGFPSGRPAPPRPPSGARPARDARPPPSPPPGPARGAGDRGMTTLDDLNDASRDAFVAHLGGIFEHSPWVAERACDRRPFASRDALHAAMVAAVREAGPERQLALLRAHPELAGRAAVRGELTEHSTREQGGSGLLDCSAEEFARLQELNRAYAERFGFPFIVAVRGLDRAGVIAAFERRLGNTREAEMAEALGQVARIAGLRLAEAVEETRAG